MQYREMNAFDYYYLIDAMDGFIEVAAVFK